MDHTIFVETAYWWRFDKHIPHGACLEAVALLASEAGPLPRFLIEYFESIQTSLVVASSK
jgi:hypothetical protein